METGSTQPAVLPPARSNSTRASLDVHAFKRLLMTGTSSANRSVPTSNTYPQGPAPGDAASTTDTSSLSKHSIFDVTAQDVFHDTPLTSHEISEAEPEEEYGQAVALSSTRRRPPPPNSRHGKLIRADSKHEGSPMSSPLSSTTPARQGQDSITTPRAATFGRALTDHNKPLPPPPPPPPRRQSHEVDRAWSISVADQSTSVHEAIPPRRHNTVPTSSKRLSQDSMRMDPLDEISSPTVPFSASSSPFHNGRAADEPSENTSRPQPRSRSSSFKAAPPTPAARRSNSVKVTSTTHTSARPPSRSSSIHSSLSVGNGKRYSYQSNSEHGHSRNDSIIPPLPPPPRRFRGGEDDTDVGVGGGTDAAAILGDLERLQRDIDQLRLEEEEVDTKKGTAIAQREVAA